MKNLPKNKLVPHWKIILHKYVLKIEQKISGFRKRIKIDPEIHFWVSHPLRLANTFLCKLYDDDNFYFSARYAWTAPEESKKLYLYGCVRLVMKASITLMENEEHILESPKKEDENTISRAVLEAFIDSQQIILRRLIETLANLINFSDCNHDEAYRIYLNVKNLNYFLSRQIDFGTFYESKSANIEESISEFRQRIDKDLGTVDITTV